jgi:putative ABC transport system substrate-binding protein
MERGSKPKSRAVLSLPFLSQSGDSAVERRTFVVVAILNLLVACASRAQEPAKHYRLGIISSGNPRSTAFYVALEARLSELGWIDGKNLTVEFEIGESLEQLSAIATRMVQHRVDVIVTVGPESTLKAASDATRRAQFLL